LYIFRQTWLAVLLTSIWFLLIILFVVIPDTKIQFFDKGYEKGQIDALNGIQHYDKIATKDSIYVKFK